jgi:hypothetical protein
MNETDLQVMAKLVEQISRDVADIASSMRVVAYAMICFGVELAIIAILLVEKL